MREHVLRIATDRPTDLLDKFPIEPFLDALKHKNPRVRAQALISLGRLGRPEACEAILPLTVRAADSKAPVTDANFHKQADPGRVIPHLAVQAIVAIGATEPVLAATDGPYSAGAFWALRNMHTPEAVSGLIRKLSTTRDDARRREVVTALICLYHNEGEYKGGWWGTRPDTSGPYYDRKPWSESDNIATAVKTVVKYADKPMLEHIGQQLARHKVNIDGLGDLAKVLVEPESPDKPIALPKFDPNNPNHIGNLELSIVASRATASADAKVGAALFKQQNCMACHTNANGQKPKGPHLVDIGKRYKRAELIESVLNPSAKIAQGFDTYLFVMDSGKQHIGFVVNESADAVSIRTIEGVAKELSREEIEVRKQQKESMMPKGMVNNLTPEQLADLLTYLESLH